MNGCIDDNTGGMPIQLAAAQTQKKKDPCHAELMGWIK
jgi:hypothetical protein